MVAIGVYALDLADGVVEWRGFDTARTKTDHAAEFAAGDEVHGAAGVARGEDAVKGTRRASALQVAEHVKTDLLLEMLGEDAGDGDSGNTGNSFARDNRCAESSGGNFGAFGDDDEAEFLARFFARFDGVADIFKGEWDFRDEDYVRAAGDAGMERDPAGAAAHDFDEHDAVMAFGGGVEAVERVSGDVERGVKAESDFSGAKIVVNRFGDADHVEPSAAEIACDAERAVTANDDHGVKAEALPIFAAEAGIIGDGLIVIVVGGIGERIAAVCGAENGAAAVDEATNGLERKLDGALGPDEAVESIADADDLPAVLTDGGIDDAADDSVEAGAIAAAVGKAEYANLISHDDLSVQANVHSTLGGGRGRRSEVLLECRATEAAEMRTCGWRRNREFHG